MKASFDSSVGKVTYCWMIGLS